MKAEVKKIEDAVILLSEPDNESEAKKESDDFIDGHHI